MAAETLRPKAVDLMGCVVTIDAAGCQREVVRRIVAKFADYLISLKGNRDALRAKCLSIQQPVFSGQSGLVADRWLMVAEKLRPKAADMLPDRLPRMDPRERPVEVGGIEDRVQDRDRDDGAEVQEARFARSVSVFSSQLSDWLLTVG